MVVPSHAVAVRDRVVRDAFVAPAPGCWRTCAIVVRGGGRSLRHIDAQPRGLPANCR